jgi:hypothetical protein
LDGGGHTVLLHHPPEQGRAPRRIQRLSRARDPRASSGTTGSSAWSFKTKKRTGTGWSCRGASLLSVRCTLGIRTAGSGTSDAVCGGRGKILAEPWQARQRAEPPPERACPGRRWALVESRGSPSAGGSGLLSGKDQKTDRQPRGPPGPSLPRPGVMPSVMRAGFESGRNWRGCKNCRGNWRRSRPD